MPKKAVPMKNQILLLLGACLVRVILACTYKGFTSDTSCFYSWACLLWENGFADFYSPDYFCDYPPGYLYILYILGGLISSWKLTPLSGLCLLLLKTPAILCDLLAGILLLSFACKVFSQKTALLLTAGYLFHPAVLINSSVWGQIDSIHTLFILLTCIHLSDRRYISAYFSYALALLLKPQSLIFAPLILCALGEDLLTCRSFRRFLYHLAGGLSALLLLFLLCIPFGFQAVLFQYTDTLSSYPYAAVNACNIWGLFGQNWITQDTPFLFFTYAQLGTFALILAVILSFLLFYHLRHRKDRYYLTGAFLITFVFMFSVRMHERYLFPAMLLLLFSFIHNPRRDFYFHYWSLSFCHFFNVFYVLTFYDPANYDRYSFPLLAVSLLTMLSGLCFFVSLTRTASDSGKGSLSFFTVSTVHTVSPSRERIPFRFTDLWIILTISLFYGCFAFTHLGIADTPVTECAFPNNTYLELDAESGQTISSLYWYLLHEQDITCRLEVKSSPDDSWTFLQDITLQTMFSWDGIELPSPVTSVRITNLSRDTNIGELILQDAEHHITTVEQASVYTTLFDEQNTFPGTLTPESGAYFDEIYYQRTVYEFLRGMPAYENTHPPLGKILMLPGILLFGTSPFGFRFMGTLFGVLMLPFIYLLGRNLTGNRFAGGLASFLFAFDFMHFVQTRLTTLDVFAVFFIILMYYFMEQYIHTSFYDMPLKNTLFPLGACGLMFGMGVAVKWTGLYAGFGLALLFFRQIWIRYREYRYAQTQPAGATKGISHSHIINTFRSYTQKTFGFCFLFFLGIPFVIYLLSYLPFSDGSQTGLLERMITNQIHMYRYHSLLTDTHPYASAWYQWPTMVRPVFYYAKQLGGNLRLGISSFGNPLVWWTGIPAFAVSCFLALKSRKNKYIFLVIGLLSQYLPWILVERCTFLYHYFPCVPFLVLMLTCCILELKTKMSAPSFYLLCILYGISVFVLFILFYPVLAGTPVSTEYTAQFLRWLDTWVLII